MKYPREVIVVGRDAEVRNGLAGLFTCIPGFSLMATYEDYRFELGESYRKIPILFILDIQDELSCILKIQSLKRLSPSFEILVHHSSFCIDMVYKLLAAGASGCLLRTKQPLEFLVAAQEITNGGAYLSPSVAKSLITSMRRSYDTLLSAREIEVLKLMARGKTYSKIAEELFIARTTAKTHIRNIYSKLNVNSKDDAIAKATHEKIIFSLGAL